MITFPESILVGKTVHEITVFSSFVRQIAGGLLDANRTDRHTAVMADKEREQLQKSINTLERQMRKEKQPRKRFEMHQRLVIMKAKLNQ